MEKEEFKKIIAYQIYNRRMDKGMSQLELADFAQLSQSAIQFYETRRRIPSAYALYNLAEVFGCSVDELCGGMENG